MRTAGVCIRAGQLYIAGVSAPLTEARVADAIEDATSKLSFPQNLSEAAQLVDLKDRVRQDLREWGIGSIHVLGTTKYVNWKYADAHTRVLAISAVMYAAAEEQVGYSLAKPSAVGPLVQSPRLDNIDKALFGLEVRPSHWNAGLAQAYATAAWALQGTPNGRGN